MRNTNRTDTPRFRRWIPALLAISPVVLTLLMGIAGLIEPTTVTQTLGGAAVAAVGGILTGIAADRFLRRSQGNAEILIGLAIVTALGVVTIGYLYLIHIRGPLTSIGALNRAVKQIGAFLTYLFAQMLGIQIAQRIGPDPEDPPTER